MSSRTWIRKLFARTPAAPISRARPRLMMESLEARDVPATFTVNSLLDDGGAGTLRWAVAQANAANDADTILFDSSVAGQTITLTQGQLKLNLGTETTIDGGLGCMTIDGNHASRVFQVDGSAAISRLTITHGDARTDTTPFMVGQGGGILARSSATLSLTGVVFDDNAAMEGGGLYNHGFATLADCTFTRNHSDGNGGGMTSHAAGTATVTDSAFSDNTTFGDGGGVRIGYGSITGSRVSDNSASVGGGISVQTGSVTVTACVITNNAASGSGGGVYSPGRLTLSRSLVAGNTAATGGGLFNWGTATVTDSTIANNTANDMGGIRNIERLTLTRTTIAGNTATSGVSGIRSGDFYVPMTLNDCIVANSGGDLDGFFSGANNIVQDGSGAGLTGTLAVDPLLAPLADYGGPTPTMALLPGSLAIGHGTAAEGTTDQRGLLRNVAPDIGAFETQVPTITVSAPNGTYNGAAHAVTTATAKGAYGETLATFGSPSLSYRYYKGALTSAQIPGATPSAGAPVDAGFYTVVADYTADTAGYRNASSTPVIFRVNQVPTTLTFTGPASAEYSGAPFTGFLTSLSFLENGVYVPVTGNTFEGGTIKVEYDILGQPNSITAPIEPGNYRARAIFTGSINYQNQATSFLSFTITKRTLSVTASAADRAYDGTTAAAATLSLGNTIPGEMPVVTFTSAAFQDKNAGVDKPVDVTGIALDSAYAAHYTLAGVTSATAAASITPRHITGTFTVADKVYDGTTAATITGRTLANVVPGDDVLAVGGSATFLDKNAGFNKTAVLAAVNTDLQGADAPNYTLDTVANATATIRPRMLTLTASAADRVYDGTNASSVTLNGDTVGGDQVSYSYFSAAFADKAAGVNKPVTVNGILLGGPAVANYLYESWVTTTASITPRHLTGTFTVADKVYDGTTTATVTSRTLANVVPGDDVQAIGGSASFLDPNAGVNKPVSLAASGADLAGADASNYTLDAYAITAATITPRLLTVAASAEDKVYDGVTAATATVTLGNAVAGESPTATFGAAFRDKNAGANKPVDVTGLALAPVFTNYTLSATGVVASASITPRALTVTATATNKVYDGTTAATVTLSDNRVADDQLSLAYTTAAFDTAAVGTDKPVTVTDINVGGADADNYTANTTATATASITPATETITLTTDRPVAVPGLAVTFTATVSAATGTVTFKDGATVLGTASVVEGVAKLTTANLQYGSRTVTATFNATSASVAVSVVSAAILSDAVSGTNALFIGGTPGNDEIEVEKECNGRYEVEIGDGCHGYEQDFDGPIGRLVVFAGAGNDEVDFDGNVQVPVWVYGGTGNDDLSGADNAPNMLFGGAGNDALRGGSKRDVLIGGAGADVLNAKGGDDLLIGGTTSYDNDEIALYGIQVEWNSTRSYEQRVANLRGTGSGPRANGDNFLKASGTGKSVFDDGSVDKFKGGGGRNWSIANRIGGVIDQFEGLASNEWVDELV